MTFSEQQIEQLWPAEVHFRSVLESNTITNCKRYLTDSVADIYESATGEKVRRNWSCSTCVFNFMHKVAKIYFADKQEIEKNQKHEHEQKEAKRDRKESKARRDHKADQKRVVTQ